MIGDQSSCPLWRLAWILERRYNRVVAQSRNKPVRFLLVSALKGDGLPETNPHGEATGLPDRPFKLYAKHSKQN